MGKISHLKQNYRSELDIQQINKPNVYTYILQTSTSCWSWYWIQDPHQNTWILWRSLCNQTTERNHSL